MELPARTRGKYKTHRLHIAVWKGILPQLIPTSADLLWVFVCDALAFETTLPVTYYCLNAIKAWHQRMQLHGPLNLATTSASRAPPGTAAADNLSHPRSGGACPAAAQIADTPALPGQSWQLFGVLPVLAPLAGLPRQRLTTVARGRWAETAGLQCATAGSLRRAGRLSQVRRAVTYHHQSAQNKLVIEL